MFERFKAVGSICYLMFLDFKLAGNNEQNWNILAFSGLTLGYIMEPFAFTFIENKYINVINIAEIVAQVFQWFDKIPDMLITPSDNFYNQLAYTLAQKHNFRGSHYFDPIIKIDRIGANLDQY